jgi:large subunit ribosomal protein L23
MQILIEPKISEKAIGMSQAGKYVFKVHPKANKAQVAHAIEELYKVKVVKVNMIHNPQEEKIIRGRFRSKIKSFKKAVVTLKKGQKIPGFEEK